MPDWPLSRLFRSRRPGLLKRIAAAPISRASTRNTGAQGAQIDGSDSTVVGGMTVDDDSPASAGVGVDVAGMTGVLVGFDMVGVLVARLSTGVRVTITTG